VDIHQLADTAKLLDNLHVTQYHCYQDSITTYVLQCDGRKYKNRGIWQKVNLLAKNSKLTR